MRRLILIAFLLVFASCGGGGAKIAPLPELSSCDFTLADVSVTGDGRLVAAVAGSAAVPEVVVSVEEAQGLKGAFFTLEFPEDKYHATSVEFGDFLGAAGEVISLAITDRAGEVPAGIVMIHPDSACGVSGEGVVARIRFASGTAGPARAASAPPTGDANKPYDLTLVETGGADEYALTWHEVNTGDYDNSGAVGISDITPLAMHYGEYVTDRNSQAALVDSSGDFVANIADITGIAMNYGNVLAGYNIYVEGFVDPMPNVDGLGDLSVMRPEIPGTERVAYSYDLTLSVMLDVTVVAADAEGVEGAASAPATVSGAAPLAPAGLTAAAGEGIGVGKIKLSWTANTEADLLEYRVYRRAGAGEFGLVAYVLPVPEPSYTDGSGAGLLEPGVLYTYYAVAVNTAGMVSEPSAEAGDSPFYPPPPSAPEWIEAEGVSDGIEVSWGAVESDYLAGYEAWRRGPGEGDYSLLLTADEDQTGFKDSDGLVQGETYSYKVRAFDSYERAGEFSSIASAAYNPTGELAIVSVTTDRTTLQVASSERAHLAVEVSDPSADITWEATDGSFAGGDTGSEVTYAPPDTGGARHVTITVTAERGADTADGSIALIITTLEDLGAAVDFSAPSFSTPAEPYRPFAHYLGEGKVMLLDFGAIGCQGCEAEFPSLLELYGSYSAQGFYLVVVWPNTLSQMQTWLNAKGYGEYTDHYQDTDSDILGLYVDAFTGEESVPMNFLIDRDGNVRHWEIGEINEGDWADYIGELL